MSQLDLKLFKRTIPAFAILVIFLSGCTKKEKINLFYDNKSSVQSYAVNLLVTNLNAAGFKVSENGKSTSEKLEIIVLNLQNILSDYKNTFTETPDSLKSDESFQIKKEGNKIFITAKSDKGCLYGATDVVEQLGNNPDLSTIKEKTVNPAMEFRAIKFNLPWSPYRPGPATDLHYDTCRNLDFWKAFLDMMVKNRFNALTLWTTDPFTTMVRAKNYPLATPFNDDELLEWKTFWKSLFKMAKERGIETFLVNWNIVVSPEFAKHYGAEIHDDRSELVKKYTRESVTQLINEYEDLTGLGVTLADWMGNWGNNQMSPSEREDWIQDTFVEGMKLANRKIKFIHRAVLAGDPAEMKRVIDYAGLPDKTIVEIKFNWSHAHSTPNLSITHANDEGSVMSDFWTPTPDNYFIAWMMRNEDFFVLRWGDPEFIREHIKTNKHDYVGGYFVGSEGYIPAKDYSHADTPEKTWKYAFEKQWAFYHFWGRLMYNPNETDETLSLEFKRRYKKTDIKKLLEAYTLASKVPEAIATFYKGTWDFTLYSEGFLAPWQNGFDDQKSPFISIEELVKHETLDPHYLSIGDFCRLKNNDTLVDSLITPFQLADRVQYACTDALQIINSLKSGNENPTLNSELQDLETWCYMGFYFSDKIRAGVTFQNFLLNQDVNEKKLSLEYLENCVNHWRNIIRLTENRYKPMPYVSMGHHEPRWPEFTAFHWKYFLKDVQQDFDFVQNYR